MTPAGIVLLVVGVIIIAVSFFIPDKGDKETKEDIEKKREQIRRLMDTEIDSMKLRVNEATNETVEFGMEKSERALEKIANEKIMAVSEYAATVIEEIERNHKEVMFLYDMLNDKQTDVKNTVRHAEATMKEVSDAAKTASDAALYATNVANAATETASMASETVSAVNMTAETMQSSMQGAMQGSSMPGVLQNDAASDMWHQERELLYSATDGTQNMDSVVSAPVPEESVFGMAARNRDDFSMLDIPELTPIVPQTKEEPVEVEELTEFEMLERSTSFSNTSNNNQQILKLSAQGMSAVDIARQLNLGVGEVQLVIDLFR